MIIHDEIRGGKSLNMSHYSLPSDVVLFSTADWDTRPWTNKQHMACHLASNGFRVFYVESTGIRRPTADLRDFNRIFRRLSKGLRPPANPVKNIFIFSPLVIPFFHGPIVDRINRHLLGGMLRYWLKRLDFRRYLTWTYNPMSCHYLNILHSKGFVYHCVDDLAAVPNTNQKAIETGEKALFKMADVVFVTSKELYATWKKAWPQKVHYLPNVADYDHFTMARRPGPLPRDTAAIPRPRFGYIGTLSDYKIDFDMILKVAERRPDWHWVLVGGEREGQADPFVNRLMRLDNIHFLGYRDYSRLPAYLRGMDIATLPLKKNRYTKSMFPMKFFEYLSAGKPVLATPIEALGDYKRAYACATTPEEFIAKAERILDGQIPDRTYADQLARSHTWAWRTKEMLNIVSDALQSR